MYLAVVIVGAGAVAESVVATLIENAFRGRISVIGQEVRLWNSDRSRRLLFIAILVSLSLICRMTEQNAQSRFHWHQSSIHLHYFVLTSFTMERMWICTWTVRLVCAMLR